MQQWVQDQVEAMMWKAAQNILWQALDRIDWRIVILALLGGAIFLAVLGPVLGRTGKVVLAAGVAFCLGGGAVWMMRPEPPDPVPPVVIEQPITIDPPDIDTSGLGEAATALKDGFGETLDKLMEAASKIELPSPPEPDPEAEARRLAAADAERVRLAQAAEEEKKRLEVQNRRARYLRRQKIIRARNQQALQAIDSMIGWQVQQATAVEAAREQALMRQAWLMQQQVAAQSQGRR